MEKKKFRLTDRTRTGMMRQIDAHSRRTKMSHLYKINKVGKLWITHPTRATI